MCVVCIWKKCCLLLGALEISQAEILRCRFAFFYVSQQIWFQPMTQVTPAHKHAHTHKYGTPTHIHIGNHAHTHLGTDGAKNLFETETRLQQANVCAAPVHVCECVQVCECVCAYFTSNSYTLTPFAGFSISFFPCCCRRILFFVQLCFRAKRK